MNSATIASKLTSVIINPLIALIFAAGLLIFVWGLIEFLIGINIGEDTTKKEEGKMHMLWGIIGMFVMVSAYAILRFIAANVGSNAAF